MKFAFGIGLDNMDEAYPGSSWFGSYSHLFCTAVYALGWILQSHRCVQGSYTMVLVSSTGFP